MNWYLQLRCCMRATWKLISNPSHKRVRTFCALYSGGREFLFHALCLTELGRNLLRMRLLSTNHTMMSQHVRDFSTRLEALILGLVMSACVCMRADVHYHSFAR